MWKSVMVLRSYLPLRSLSGFVVVAMFAACTTADHRARPFTRQWVNQVKSEQAFDQRKARLRGDEQVVLVGDPEGARAAIVADESGRPRLNVGMLRGLSADLDYDDGPEAELKYKHEWDFGRPKRREAGR